MRPSHAIPRALLALGLLALVPRAALAQDRSADARREFEHGVQLLDDSRFAEAAASFERSLALRESASTLYNLGLAYRGMGHYRQAVRTLERFLERAHTGDASVIEDARSVAAELRRSLAHVALTVQGGATEVVADGERVAVRDGVVDLELDPGTHALEARRRGYRPAHRDVTLAPAARETVTLDASTTPLPAVLSVEVDLPRAAVSIDGEPVGYGRAVRELSPGHHVVDVADGQRAVAHRSVDLAPGARERVLLTVRTTSPLATWWFWTGTALVAGAITTGVVLLAPRPWAPYETGSLGVVVEAVRQR